MEQKIKLANQKSGYSQTTSRGKTILSVIIPAYNLEDDIVICLESVLAQNVEDMEVLVVDNGSKDGTATSIRRVAEKDPRVKPIFLKKNCMPSGARNAALDVAEGKYIHFCDGDDMVPEGAYEELLRVAEEENADVVTGNYSRKYPSEGNVIRPFSHYQEKDGFARCFESGNTTLWNKIFKRSLIEKQHLRFSMELRHSEDFLLYLQILYQNPVVAYTDKSIYIYTEPYHHEESDKTNTEIRYASLRCVKDGIYVYKKIFVQPIDHHEELWFIAFCSNLNWHLQCSWRLIQNPQERKDAFEVLQSALLEVQETTTACDWTKEDHMGRFVEIFGVDFYTFASMRYEDYMYLFYQRQGIRPRTADRVITREIGRLRGTERDQVLALGVEQIMDDIRATYGHEIAAARQTWKNHYYNLIDSAINDYWRQISSREVKEDLFGRLQNFVAEMRTTNRLCAFGTEDDIFRFQHIFCVDYAALQALTCSQYVMLCATSACGSGGGGSSESNGYYAPRPLEYYVAACRNGRLGLRGILKGLMAWLKYKLRRRR